MIIIRTSIASPWKSSRECTSTFSATVQVLCYLHTMIIIRTSIASPWKSSRVRVHAAVTLRLRLQVAERKRPKRAHLRM